MHVNVVCDQTINNKNDNDEKDIQLTIVSIIFKNFWQFESSVFSLPLSCILLPANQNGNIEQTKNRKNQLKLRVENSLIGDRKSIYERFDQFVLWPKQYIITAN